jgi:uroporphyrinogen-III synthase
MRRRVSERESMATKVAVFRARKDAAASAVRLRRLGLSVVSAPVFEIAALPFRPARDHYDAVIASSAKAFLTDAPIERDALLYAVGASTGRAAKAQGWRLARPPAPDAERLIAAIRTKLAPGSKVLYLAGRDRKPAIEAALRGLCALEVVETYAANARRAWSPSEIRGIAASAAALHYSARSAELALSLAGTAGLTRHFLGLTHVCASAEIGRTLEAFGMNRLVIAESPDEAGLLAALGRAGLVFPSG